MNLEFLTPFFRNFDFLIHKSHNFKLLYSIVGKWKMNTSDESKKIGIPTSEQDAAFVKLY